MRFQFIKHTGKNYFCINSFHTKYTKVSQKTYPTSSKEKGRSPELSLFHLRSSAIWLPRQERFLPSWCCWGTATLVNPLLCFDLLRISFMKGLRVLLEVYFSFLFFSFLFLSYLILFFSYLFFSFLISSFLSFFFFSLPSLLFLPPYPTPPNPYQTFPPTPPTKNDSITHSLSKQLPS